MSFPDPGKIEAWLRDYAGSYLCGDGDLDRHVRMKFEHTLRVRDNIRILCRELGCPGRDGRIAEIIALLHDAGRFEQYRRYRTFIDRLSDNHAYLGLREIARAKLLDGHDSGDRRLITRAIAFHNAARLPGTQDSRSSFFMRLIRDADKLDIWHVLLENYGKVADGTGEPLVYKLPDSPEVSDTVLETLLKGGQVDFGDIATLTDLKLLQISWVYDLNFPPSYAAVQKGRVIERFQRFLPDNPSIGAALRPAVEYIAHRAAKKKSATGRGNRAAPLVSR